MISTIDQKMLSAAESGKGVKISSFCENEHGYCRCCHAVVMGIGHGFRCLQASRDRDQAGVERSAGGECFEHFGVARQLLSMD